MLILVAMVMIMLVVMEHHVKRDLPFQFPLVKMFLVLCQRQEMGDMDSQSFLLSHQDGLLQRIDSLSLSNRYYVMYKIAKEATTLVCPCLLDVCTCVCCFSVCGMQTVIIYRGSAILLRNYTHSLRQRQVSFILFYSYAEHEVTVSLS